MEVWAKTVNEGGVCTEFLSALCRHLMSHRHAGPEKSAFYINILRPELKK